MQNQPPETYQVVYEQVDLQDGFPIQDMFKGRLMFTSAPVTLMHFHNVLEIGLCYQGCGLFFIDGRVEPYSAGDVNVIFPDQVHVLQSDKIAPSQWDFIMLNPTTLLSEISIADLNLVSALYGNRNAPSGIFRSGGGDGVADGVKRIFQEIGSPAPYGQSMLKSMVWELMVALARLRPSLPGEGQGNPKTGINRIAPALNYIADHYFEEVRIEDLTKACMMSPTNLRRLFASALGKSPSEYLYEVRIKMASLLLLNSSRSVLDIAMNVGYPTLSGFNRHFRKYMGVSPKSLRKSNPAVMKKASANRT